MPKVDVSKGIEVGPSHYSVVCGEDTNKELESKAVYGDCAGLLRRIRVATNTSEEQFSTTFLHESLEAINDIWCNSKLEHELLTNLANGLSQVLRGLGISFKFDNSR